jgi:hypothetical protein
LRVLESRNLCAATFPDGRAAALTTSSESFIA